MQRTLCQGNNWEMYSLWSKIDMRGSPVAVRTKITEDYFQEQFEGVSRKKYEVEPGMIVRVVARDRDLRGNEKAVDEDE